ncbi:MAG: hypothetical protein LKE85_07270 [Lachnospiraceae bacterium]|nr:hypothetical protein [Lachnospiraceae bacterium]
MIQQESSGAENLTVIQSSCSNPLFVTIQKLRIQILYFRILADFIFKNPASFVVFQVSEIISEHLLRPVSDSEPGFIMALVRKRVDKQ